MTEETKKLITAGMLSDVLGKKVHIKTDRNGAIEYFEAEGNEHESEVSFCELKDKLDGWLCRRGYVQMAWDSCSWIMSFDDGIKISVVHSPSKLEALLKLYHAVKGE